MKHIDTKEIPIGKIKENDYNPRKKFDTIAQEELKNSIKTTGLLQPLVVRPVEKGEYELICGERRRRACKALKINPLCRIVNMDREEAIEASFIENYARQNLNIIEEAMYHAQRLGKWSSETEKISVSLRGNSYGLKDYALKVGVSEKTVLNRIQLLHLPEVVQNMIISKTLKPSHAVEIAQLYNIRNAEKYMAEVAEDAQEIEEENKPMWSISQVKERVERLIDQDKHVDEAKDVEKKIAEDSVRDTDNELKTIIGKLKKAYKELPEIKSPEDYENVKKYLSKLQKKSISDKDFKDYQKQHSNAQHHRGLLVANRDLIKRQSIRKCLYCGHTTDVSDLDKQIGGIDDVIQSLEHTMGKLNVEAKRIAKDVREFNNVYDSYQNAVERLEAILEE